MILTKMHLRSASEEQFPPNRTRPDPFGHRSPEAAEFDFPNFVSSLLLPALAMNPTNFFAELKRRDPILFYTHLNLRSIQKVVGEKK